jgi:GntP family gluconate:H+ symporter
MMGGAPSWWPFAILAFCVAMIVVQITVLKINAFIALILAAIVAGLLSPVGSLPGEPAASHWVQAVEVTAAKFGEVTGGIGIAIALASVLSMCLMESGAADKVVRRFLSVFGPKRAGVALLVSSYVISIPIFFDIFFMLLLPLARAMRLRTGKDYLLFMMAICCAGTVTHSMVAPHPGPLAMADTLKVDLGFTIVAGLLAGIVPVAASWLYSLWLNRRMDVPLREMPGASLKDLEAVASKPESELPSFVVSILPVILPIALISTASTLKALGGAARFPSLYPPVEFAGNRNVALLIGLAIALVTLARQRKLTLAQIGDLVGPPLQTAGIVILITAAGGAFGKMLQHAGVGEAIKAAVAGRQVNLILLSYAVASVIRVAQGSATVAMLTTAGMMVPILEGGTALPYHPVYIFLSIGFGAMIFSWMNDSGFWVVSRLSGMTEKETLRSWSAVVTVNSLAGLVVTLLGAALFPMAPK